MKNSDITAAKRSQVSASGIISSSTTGTTGNKSITGLGFRPKRVEFTVLYTQSTTNSGFASGYFDESNQAVTAMVGSATNNARNYSTDDCIGYIASATAAWIMRASGVSMDSDGFTINVGMAGTTFDIVWIATA